MITQPYLGFVRWPWNNDFINRLSVPLFARSWLWCSFDVSSNNPGNTSIRIFSGYRCQAAAPTYCTAVCPENTKKKWWHTPAGKQQVYCLVKTPDVKGELSLFRSSIISDYSAQSNQINTSTFIRGQRVTWPQCAALEQCCSLLEQ